MLASAAVLAVGVSGGAALASDSSQAWNGHIQACYKPGQNPADLKLLTKGSCPKGFKTLTWNIQGSAGPRGPVGPKGATGATGARGPAGPAGPQGQKGDTGATGAAGPQGPAGAQGAVGTFGSITTYNLSTSLQPELAGTYVVGCPVGSVVISGGVTYGGYAPGVTIVADRPDPETGTPTAWYGEVANAGSSAVQFAVYAVCATPAGPAGGAAQPNKSTRPARVKGVFVPLSKA